MMQGENWSPDGEARDYIEALEVQHTSMMVGDIIENTSTGEVWLVEMFGLSQSPRGPLALNEIAFGLVGKVLS